MKNMPLVIAFGLLSGCASSTPDYDSRFGEAVRQARHAMTLNPNAGATAPQTHATDAHAVRDATERYQQSFRTPPPVVNVINIGGSINETSGTGGR